VSFFEFETSCLRLLPNVQRIRYIFEGTLKQEALFEQILKFVKP
jgi:hypothetical protein